MRMVQAAGWASSTFPTPCVQPRRLPRCITCQLATATSTSPSRPTTKPNQPNRQQLLAASSPDQRHCRQLLLLEVALRARYEPVTAVGPLPWWLEELYSTCAGTWCCVPAVAAMQGDGAMPSSPSTAARAGTSAPWPCTAGSAGHGCAGQLSTPCLVACPTLPTLAVTGHCSS